MRGQLTQFNRMPINEALHRAAESGDLEKTMSFLALGAEVNSFIDGLTPLHRAVSKGCFPVVELLCRAGANVNFEHISKEEAGYTPLFMAIANRDLATAQFLIEARKAALNSSWGFSALSCATHHSQNQTQMIPYLKILPLATRSRL